MIYYCSHFSYTVYFYNIYHIYLMKFKSLILLLSCFILCCFEKISGCMKRHKNRTTLHLVFSIPQFMNTELLTFSCSVALRLRQLSTCGSSTLRASSRAGMSRGAWGFRRLPAVLLIFTRVWILNQSNTQTFTLNIKCNGFVCTWLVNICFLT